jgi:phage portal protein BeeE
VQVKHNVDALLRGDPKARAEALQIQRRNGVINANQWRALNDMDPRIDEGGDRYIIESNMQSDSGRLMNDLPEGTQT